MNTALDLLLAGGPVSYARYLDTVLYSPGCGYYTRQAHRVGRDAAADFYTSESLGPVFARLVCAAAVDRLPAGQRPAETTFVEIAAEPGRCLLDHAVGHPFGGSRVIRQGESVSVTGPVVIFANEWLDALPFHRLCFVEGRWRERGVVRRSDGTLADCLLAEPSKAVAERLHRLPCDVEEGWQLDWPIAAEEALTELAAAPWTGTLLLFDYGKRLDALLGSYPEGTARTYRAHRAGTDLFESPGETDITCDVIWDPLEGILEAAGFSNVSLRRQEAFFVETAAGLLESIVNEAPEAWKRDRFTLFELLHPGNLGAKFQVLSASRGEG